MAQLPKGLELWAWQVKKTKARKAVQIIKSTRGPFLHKTQDILKEFEQFYSSLYKSHKPDDTKIRSFLQIFSAVKQLSESHKSMLDADITTEEIKAAIKNMKTNKSPSPDGFPVEFLITFADILAPEIQKTFNSVIQTGLLPPS